MLDFPNLYPHKIAAGYVWYNLVNEQCDMVSDVGGGGLSGMFHRSRWKTGEPKIRGLTCLNRDHSWKLGSFAGDIDCHFCGQFDDGGEAEQELVWESKEIKGEEKDKIIALWARAVL